MSKILPNTGAHEHTYARLHEIRDDSAISYVLSVFFPHLVMCEDSRLCHLTLELAQLYATS